MADFDLIGDSLSTSSQESGPLLTSAASLAAGRAKHSQPEVTSNLLNVPSSSNPSLMDHDDGMSSDISSPWTPSTSATMMTENDIPDVLWQQEHRTASNNVTNSSHNNRSGTFSNSQTGHFTSTADSSSLAREMAVDGPLQSNRLTFTDNVGEGRLRVALTDTRSRNSYAGPGIYERERLYEDQFTMRRLRKSYHPLEGSVPANPSEYMRFRHRNQRLDGNYSNLRFQERQTHPMFHRHGSTSNIMQSSRLAAANDDGTTGYQGRYEEPVDYFLSQPPYFHEHRATNEPSGYALSQPAHTFRTVRPSVVHAADLDPNSEAPHLRHLSQDDQSSQPDTPTYRSSPVSEGMRLDAATYHGSRMLRFSDIEDDDNYPDQFVEEVDKQHASRLVCDGIEMLTEINLVACGILNNDVCVCVCLRLCV